MLSSVTPGQCPEHFLVGYLMQELILTARAHETARFYEDVRAGKVKLPESAELLQAELDRVLARNQKIQGVIAQLGTSNPQLAPQLERTLMYCVDIDSSRPSTFEKPSS